MTLKPRSLWGRLTLLLLGVLLIAQMLSAALHFRDRGEVLKYVAGYNAAQRIAGMVHVLDVLTKTQREVMVKALDLPPLRMRLTDAPRHLPASDRAPPRARLFHQLLHFRLGADRPIRVYLPDVRTPSAPDTNWAPSNVPPSMYDMMLRHRGFLLNGYSFIVQVELKDGQWVTFGYHLPERLAAWPWDLLVALLILLAAVLLVSFLAVRWLTRPLSALAEAADRLGKDISHTPLPEVGPTEVKRAARAFNTMQARLSRFVEERTRFLAAVSHDLKTPVTRMRLRTEKITEPELREKFQHDLQEMQTLVQSSLDFMHGMALQEKTSPLDIDALLESLVEDAHEQGHQVRIEGSAQGPYVGKPLALKRCLGNLLGNAIRYGEEISVKVDDSPSQLSISIADRGPGIPEELLDDVFEPFFRVESSRNAKTGGTGLGLSIARNIARGHGGDLRLFNRSGGGIEAVLKLPR